MKKLLFVLSALSLTACAVQTSEIVSTSGDVYTVSGSQRGGFHRYSHIEKALMKNATDFCAAKNKKVIVDKIQDSGANGAVNAKNVQLNFKCQ